MLLTESVEPQSLRRAAELGLGLESEPEVVLGMPPPKLLGIRRSSQRVGGELANRLQHPVAPVREANEALVHQRLERVEVGITDVLGRLQRAAAREDGEPGEQPLLLLCQQVVGPLDRRSQRPLALGEIARSAGQQRQAMLEPFEDLRRGEGLDAGGRELERQREVVEATADLGDSLVGLEVGLHGSRPGKEEADPFLVNERRHRVLLLTGYMQRLPARDEEVEVRAGGKQLRNVGCCLHDLLEVVEEAEHLLVLDVLGQAVLRADDLRCRGEDELGVAERGKRDPPDAVRVAIRDETGGLCGESRLARPPRPGEREQARVRRGKERGDLCELCLSSEKRRRRDGKVRPVEAVQCRECLFSELVDALGGGEVLQAVLAEVRELDLDELGGGRGDEHLAAVARRPRGGRPGGRRRRRIPPL